MPADFEIDLKQGVVFSRGFGVFTRSGYLDQMERLRRDSRFRPEFNQLVDCRAIPLMDLTAAQIHDLAKKSVFNPVSLRVFVTRSEIHSGLSRILLGAYTKFMASERSWFSRKWQKLVLG